MAIETASYVNALVSSNPPDTDPEGQGATHLRLIKSTLTNTFPNLNGAVTATPASLNAAGALQPSGTGPLVVPNVATSIPFGGTSYATTITMKGATAHLGDATLATAPNALTVSMYDTNNSSNQTLLTLDRTNQVVAVGTPTLNIQNSVSGFGTDNTKTTINSSSSQVTVSVNGTALIQANTSGTVSLPGATSSLSLPAGASLKIGTTPIGFIGMIVMWSGAIASIPTGWHLCDGTNGTPDLHDRFIVGAGVDYTVGQIGGANTVALSIANLPAHNHGVNDPGHTHSINDPGHVHGYSAPVGSGNWVQGSAATQFSIQAANTNAATTGISNVAAATGITTQNTGSGSAFSIVPSFYALAFIMRIA
jgi:microcystin-dependent protein